MSTDNRISVRFEKPKHVHAWAAYIDGRAVTTPSGQRIHFLTEGAAMVAAQRALRSLSSSDHGVKS